jgi:3-deoxy-manno-octulosonate cytidylyltransferase (CMP-KDO synthetase)
MGHSFAHVRFRVPAGKAPLTYNVAVRATDNLIAVIPARLASTRLPRKALIPIAGVPMIQRVYEGTRRSARLREVIVATDSHEIEDVCRAAAIPVIITSAAHASGTDRVHEVVEKIGADAVINVQGDEPMVGPEIIDSLIDALFARTEIQVATVSTRMTGADAQLPSNTKVVTDARGMALYFSRAPIPYPRDGVNHSYRKHLGFYAYSRDSLARFSRLPASRLEQIERLEQLRFLENGIPIAVAEVEHDSIGVDTAEDLERVEQVFAMREPFVGSSQR